MIKYIFKNIKELSNEEWKQIIQLSCQTNYKINSINMYKILSGKYRDICINHQLVVNDKIIINCFVNKIKLYEEITNKNREYIEVNYLTSLNRDLDKKYKGIGSIFLEHILNKYQNIYLKPANNELNEYYKKLEFKPTNLKGIGNCIYPIYNKLV
jgi:hypothetical protein